MTQKERRLAPGYCAGETTQQREIQTANILKVKDQIVGVSDLGMLLPWCPHERNICKTIGLNSVIVIELLHWLKSALYMLKLIRSCFSIV